MSDSEENNDVGSLDSYGSISEFITLVRSFSSDKHSDVSIEDFFDSLEDAIELARWPERVVKVVIKSKLKGVALEYFRTNPQINRSPDLSTIKRVMMERFSVKSARQDNLMSLLKARQGRDESVLDFSIRIENMQQNINAIGDDGEMTRIGGGRMKKIFMEGIKDIIKMNMLSMEPNTFADAVRLARVVEKNLGLLKSKTDKEMHVLALQGESGLNARHCGGDDAASAMAGYVNTDNDKQEEARHGKMMGMIVKKLEDKCSITNKDRVGGVDVKLEKSENQNDKAISLGTDIFINKRKTRALLDLAADQSMVCDEVIQECKLDKKVYGATKMRISGIGRGGFNIDKYIDLYFKFDLDNKVFKHRFAIISREQILGHDVILGSDLLYPNKVVIDTGSLNFKFGDRCMGKVVVTYTARNSINVSIARICGPEKAADEGREITMATDQGVIKKIEMDYKKCGRNDRTEERVMLLKNLVNDIEDIAVKKLELEVFLVKYQAAFAIDVFDLTGIKGFIHKVELVDYTPINEPQYVFPISKRELVRKKINQYLDAGIIKKSTSPWNVPLLARQKPSGDIRLVLDAKRVNERTIKIDYPFIKINNMLAKLERYSIFSVLDLESGFNQIELHEESRKLFAFRTQYGKYEFCKLPQGAVNSAFYFQRAMEKILEGVLSDRIIVFQDDVLIASMGIEEHFRDLELVLDRFLKWGVKVKIKKCNLFKKEVKFLGHRITHGELKPDPEYVSSIVDFRAPRTIREVRKFVGKINFYAKFVPCLSNVAVPITNLIKGGQGDVKWGMEEELAFKTIKKTFMDGPVLKTPDYSKPFVLTVSATDVAIASVLEQNHEGVLWPLGYYSRKLREAEIRYSNIEKNALAIVDSMTHFHYVIYAYPLIIRSSYRSIEFLKGLRDGNSRINGWIIEMTKHSPEFVKFQDVENSMAYILASCKREEEEIDAETVQIMERDESNLVRTNGEPGVYKEEVTKVYTDGCCLRNGREEPVASVGVFWGDGDKYNFSAKVKGRCTNNRAEILAAISAIEIAQKRGIRKLSLYTDSKYLIDSMQLNIEYWKENGWCTRNKKEVVNKDEFNRLSILLKDTDVEWNYTPGHAGVEGNERAHLLAKMEAVKLIEKGDGVGQVVEGLEGPKAIMASRTMPYSHPSRIDEHKIKRCQIEDPEVMKIRSEILSSVSNYSHEGGILCYINECDMVCARGVVHISKGVTTRIDGVYIPEVLRKEVIGFAHNSKWTIHGGFVSTCFSILDNYFWATFRKDVRGFLENCVQCQLASEKRRKAPIQWFESPSEPLDTVALDIVGPLLKSIDGYSYILNIIDMFTRHITIIPLRDQRTESIINAVERIYISKYGCPHKLLTDRGSNFRSELFEMLCSTFGIKHVVSGPYRPQTNGLVERANRSLKNKITHLCNKAGVKWSSNLHFVEFSINNSYHSSIGRSPNEMLYGRRLHCPGANKITNGLAAESKDVQQYHDNLVKRLREAQELAREQDKRTRFLRNKRINESRKLTKFKVGDKVLYRAPVCGKSRKLGFRYAFTGPFSIVSVVSDISYDIRDEREGPNSRLKRANIDRLKCFKEEGMNKSVELKVQQQEINPCEDRLAEEIEISDDKENVPVRRKGFASRQFSKQDGRYGRPGGVSERQEPNGENIGKVGSYFTRSKGSVDKDIYDKFKFSRGKILEK